MYSLLWLPGCGGPGQPLLLPIIVSASGRGSLADVLTRYHAATSLARRWAGAAPLAGRLLAAAGG